MIPTVGRITPPNPPTNLCEWLWYVRQYEKVIFVRDKDSTGKWGAIALSELSAERWAYHVGRWIADGLIVPIRAFGCNQEWEHL